MKFVQASSVVAALPVAAAAAAASGTFDILSMNVAGLPPIFNGNDVPGDKATNARQIGTYFSEYNYGVINVQEDFNYHAYIYETDTHPYRTATTGGAGIGSGLNSLANFPWLDFRRIKWSQCSSASGADCLTPKGFTFMRVQVDEGVYVDSYNLHTDAGTEADDTVARNSNLHQVADYIDLWSKGNAVMVFGDTNSRYTRTTDDIRVFGEQNGLNDPWVELARNGQEPSEESLCENPSTTDTCETVDKVFYRGSPVFSLEATDFRYESSRFLQSSGDILSDHNPIAVVFNWTLSSSLRQSNFYGGPHGSWFSDLPTLTDILAPRVSTIVLRGGARIDAVGITLTDGTSFTHGGSGGDEVKLTLDDGEYWTEAVVCQGKKNDHTRIFSIQVSTSSGRTLKAGTSTEECVTFTAPDGWQVVGFTGQADDEVDQLALVYAPQ